MYHEVDHYLKWLRSANIRIFLSRQAEGAAVLWTSCIVIIKNRPAKVISNAQYFKCEKKLFIHKFINM